MAHKNRVEQAGFVSIIVAALLMIILSLITVGFTRLMQREQRQAVDRQLSRTALYAAESGVNDVLARIADPAVHPVYDLPAKTTCDVTDLGPFDNGNLVSLTDDSIAYTCALYDEAPGALQFDNITVDDSKVVELKTAGPDPFESLTITWGNPGGNAIASLSPCGSTSLSHPAVRGGAPPLVRLDLTSIPAAPYSRDALLNNTEYLYLEPCRDVPPPLVGHAFDPAVSSPSLAPGSVDVARVECTDNGDQSCQIMISNLSSIPSNTFLARIGAVYGTANVSVSGLDAGGFNIQFSDAQIGVDVTARANDVVRRLRVNVPVTRNVDIPEAALQVFNGVCKRLDVIDDTPILGIVDIVDECSSPPVPPDPLVMRCDNNLVPPQMVSILQSVATGDPVRYTLLCPAPPGVCPSLGPSAINFPLSSIALTEAHNLGIDYSLLPPRHDEIVAASTIDAYYDVDAVVGTNEWYTRWSHPDLDIGSHTPDPTLFRIAPGCKYSVEYTSFCLAPIFGSHVWGTPPVGAFACADVQLNEGLRMNFYTASGPGRGGWNQCDRTTLVAYFDIPDHYVGPAVPSSVVESGLPVILNSPSVGQITCVEFVAACEVGITHGSAYTPSRDGCTQPISAVDSSSFLHSLTWTEEPI